jgi:hypothetical protein
LVDEAIAQHGIEHRFGATWNADFAIRCLLDATEQPHTHIIGGYVLRTQRARTQLPYDVVIQRRTVVSAVRIEVRVALRNSRQHTGLRQRDVGGGFAEVRLRSLLNAEGVVAEWLLIQVDGQNFFFA